MFGPEVAGGSKLETLVLVNGEGAGVAASAFLAGQPEVLDCADTGPDDMAFWMYSSGSTGRPKGIVHLHHDMAYTQASFGTHTLRLRADDVCFSVPKIYFAYGFGNAITFPFSVGATTVLLPGQPRPEAVLDVIETFKPTVFFGLPTLYTALARAEGVAGRDLSSIRQSMSAAEILSADIYAAWKALVGHGPTEGLGSTEVLHVYLSNHLDDHRLGAAGARVPGYEIKLVTPEGREAAPGQEGVMWVRGHSTAPVYWNRPDKTRETMRDDWIYTGDRFVERDGYYYFQGRADDLIKVSGQWVWPLEVERCLNDHAQVHECAVLAHELADRRMTLRAVVSLKPGVTPDAAVTRALQDHVKAALAPYKYPRIVEFVSELPKTGTGKIDRQALVTRAV
jgi:benzoate-CoA ligase family protein